MIAISRRALPLPITIIAVARYLGRSVHRITLVIDILARHGGDRTQDG